MITPALEKKLRERLDRLAVEQRRRVLELARTLAATRAHGVPGQSLLRFAGAIEADDLVTIAQTIEEGREKVDLRERDLTTLLP